LVRTYRQLIATTRAVVRDAKTIVRQTGFEAVFVHQPNHALAADALIVLEEIAVNARAAVAPVV
jgi:hypothetical protein